MLSLPANPFASPTHRGKAQRQNTAKHSIENAFVSGRTSGYHPKTIRAIGSIS